MKKVLKGMAMLLLGLTMVACNQSSKNEKNETLVIYSNSLSNGRGDWLKEKASEAGFSIELVEIGGAELANRLIAEKNNSIADMVFGLNNLEYTRLKNEDLLAKYEPTWKDEVDMSLGDAEGYYYPIVIQPLVLIGRQGVEMPKDWTDLVDKKYEGRYAIFGLQGGTSKTILGSIVSRYPDPQGDLGVSKEGWEVVKNYIGNSVIVQGTEDYVSRVINEGDLDYVMMWGSGLLQNQKERDYKFQYMKPEIGVPFVTEQTAILSTTAKKEKAEEFINWFGSAEMQSAWSEKFGTIPANKKSLETVSQDVKEFVQSVKPQDLDWTFISENINSWIEKAELEFMK